MSVFFRLYLEAQFSQCWLLIRPTTQGPVKESILFSDRKIVDAGVSSFHKPSDVELPILVAIGPVPLPRVVMPLICEADSNPVSIESPKLFDEAVV